MTAWGAVDGGDQSVPCICITGMHRTGTSLVAGLLQRHGLWLGDDADMMPPNPYNPDGYFENKRLVDLNDEILSTFDGGWSSPPDFPAGWTEDPRLAGVRDSAREMRERLGAGRSWGFKDPRTSLTLPFWRSVWGDLTLVVAVRNPLETARSLQRRDRIPIEQALSLWSTHYRSLLAHTTPETRIVVDYEGFCVDPVASAAALLSRLPSLPDADPDIARESVRAALRHHHATMGDLEAHGARADVLELYSQLRSEAVNRVATEAQADALRTLADALSGLDLAIRDVHADLQRLAVVVARLEIEIGFVRSSDLTGIAALLENQRTHEMPSLASAVERIEAAIGANGRPA